MADSGGRWKRWWFKWWVFFCLLIPTALSITLLVASIREWTFSKPASDFIRTNRASVQLAIQVVSALLALVHSLAVCRLLGNGGRLHLASKASFTIGQLRGWATMATPKIDLCVPILYVVLASLVASLSIISSALWVGAMTPVEARAFSNGTIAIPSFANLSLMTEYPSEAKLPEGQRAAPEDFTEYGLFSYKVGIRYISSLIASAASATTIDGSVRKSAKVDNTQFVYVGRSYGTGAAVGIRDKDISEANFPAGRPTTYQYVETSYNISASCIYNASTDFRITVSNPRSLWIYAARGRLPDSTSEEYSSYFGHSPKAIVAMGVAAAPARPRYVGIAAGEFYKQLDAIQCSIDFSPARFNVTVSLTNRTISVSKPAGEAGDGEVIVEDIDPSGLVAKVLIRQFELIANDLTNLYQSVLADALLASAQAWKASQGSTDEAEYTLRGVENSLIAMADDMLALYGAAQLIVGHFEQPMTVSVTLAVLKPGVWQYALAATAVNAAIVIAIVAEVIRTRGWRAMPSFDFTDMGWLLLATFRGGSLSAGSHREVYEELGIIGKGETSSRIVVAHQGDGDVSAAEETRDLVVQLQQNGDHSHNTLLVIEGAR
ncbi:hypothetical protein MAPG_00950 [Magnaporthiopsis poae ATCC 64411]|uniref:Uncharacterized protein n=1 Tax=Magnaporthiopsis poae (strain ATCC 64411 / 73-15) TaxID=644358 RepID=A0A0C4DME4_MAGP6|nr:hypothetical protein MAPG_00950 [Magnaporthiopsis poae ATCC 64411]